MPRAKADANKPRGRMTAYAFFVQTCREEHKKKHPDENVVFAEFSKKCAERWKVRSNSDKYIELTYVLLQLWIRVEHMNILELAKLSSWINFIL